MIVKFYILQSSRGGHRPSACFAATQIFLPFAKIFQRRYANDVIIIVNKVILKESEKRGVKK